MSDKRLHIYKASAGAGKTHTMTEAFLRHVLRDPHSSYREVQAVTFTNLATGELRQRFFKELDTLAKDPEQSPFYESFKESYSKEKLKLSAKLALQEILFDYGGLRVKTIDSFFQDIIHALAIELKQRPTTRIELSKDQILDLAVERLFDTPTDKARLAIQSFLSSREDKSMRSLQSSLKLLARQLYNEQVQELDFEGKQLFDYTTYQQFVEAVETKVREIEQHISNQRDRFKELAAADGLDEQTLPYKSRSPFFRLLGDEPRQTTIGATDSYISKAIWDKYTSSSQVETLFDGKDDKYIKGLEGSAILPIYYDIVRSHTDLFTLQTAIRKGYELQLLGEIQDNIKLVVEELGVTLLDDAKRLIRTLVGEPSSTAFIYERLGTKLRYHMIDEFQDTSRFQYENFKPLLEEALGSGGESFIVGDVKQSIYRFRSSDPKLLKERLADDFATYQITKSLLYNWRSAPAIVSFNNRFFSLLPSSPELQVEGDTRSDGDSLIKDVYNIDEVHQEIPSSHRQMAGGVFVHRCTEFKSESDTPSDKLQAKIDYLLSNVIPALLERGYKQSDIAILTPKNDTLQRIAESIIRHNKDDEEEQPARPPLAFVSREMLTLDANPLYRLIIELLYSVLANAGAPETHYAKSFEHRLAVAHLDQIAKGIPLSEETPPFDFARCYLEGQSASLYELLLLIVKQLEPLTTPTDRLYIDALLDTVQDYSQDNYVDLQGFLEWLESHTPKLSLETQDAIQLLTIHSAKGLGFPVVCLLEYQMQILSSSDTVWCLAESIKEPLQALLGEKIDIPPLLPVSPTNEAKATPFGALIAQESASAQLDRINALYVAMTRAKSEMHLILEESDGAAKRSVNFERLISQLVTQLSETAPSKSPIASTTEEIPLHITEERCDTEALEVTRQMFLAEGCPLLPETEELPNQSAQPTPETSQPRPIPRISSESEVAQLYVRRSQSVGYQAQDAVRNGLFLHALLSEIDYLDDTSELRQFLSKKALQGLIPLAQVAPLAALIEKALTDPLIASYYQRDSGWQVINERSMARQMQTQDEHKTHTRIERPDRIVYDAEGQHAVIIDYKSGDEAQHYTARHKRQLRNYRQTLLESGFQTVQAYLLYLSPEGHQVVEVD